MRLVDDRAVHKTLESGAEPIGSAIGGDATHLSQGEGRGVAAEFRGLGLLRIPAHYQEPGGCTAESCAAIIFCSGRLTIERGDYVDVDQALFVGCGDVEVIFDSMLNAAIHLLEIFGFGKNQGNIVKFVYVERRRKCDARWRDAVGFRNQALQRVAAKAPKVVAAEVAAFHSGGR